MESLAIFVGFLLGSLLLSILISLGFAFVRKLWATIITGVAASYSVILGSILLTETLRPVAGGIDGELYVNTNMLWVGGIPVIVGLVSLAISITRYFTKTSKEIQK